MSDLIEMQCSKAAVFSDIHSNFHAFRACYLDAVERGADCFVFLGDYVSDLADPRKTMDLVYEIRERWPTVCLRGNRERYLLEKHRGQTVFSPGSKSGSLLYTDSQLAPRDLAFFDSLPAYGRAVLNGRLFELAHAVREDDRFYFDQKNGRIPTVARQMEADFLLTGHAHKQYVACWEGKTILNPGSIGVPRGYGYLTQYAMLEFDGAAVRPVLYQLPYDVEGLIRRQFESDLFRIAPHWAVSLLYDVITGEEYTLALLDRVCRMGAQAVQEEESWHTAAVEMGMAFTEEALLALFREHRTALTGQKPPDVV